MNQTPSPDVHLGPDATSAQAPNIAPVFSAARIAEILAEPPKPAIVPTAEQSAVIEHRLSGSALVVAGAGSGKTETMGNRVVWLVANGLVAPEQVLGLTFTRKAAGELRERISGRLAAFAGRLRDHAERGGLSTAEAERAAALDEVLGDGLDLPEVSTYNAFAAGVLQEFGVAAGVAPGAVIIDEATAWRLAREVVLGSRDPELVEVDLSTAGLVRHVLAIDHAVSDNLTSFDRVDQIAAEFDRVRHLPYKESEIGKEPSGKLYAPLRDALEAVGHTPLITRLARRYADEKQRRGLIEFSDQLALATRALEHLPDASAALRRRHRAVLLDEVQDTSVGQTRFLSMIFAGESVMAVGDPHQSIYGWRGASAEGLQSFHADFRRSGQSKTSTGSTLTLSTSWRNPTRVLDVANTIARPLAAEAAIPVPALAPRPGARAGSCEWVYPETVHEERLAVAAWMRSARDAHLAEHQELPSAAVVFRKRAPMAAFSAALTEAGVPNRIVGLGGLLTTPEITDIVSALRCIWYADASDALIRLLAGPRFRVGVADLAGLGRAARWFAERDIAQRPIDEADRAADAVLPDPDRRVTLVDALDQIAQLRDLEHRALAGVSEDGRERLRSAGRMLAGLRQGVGGSVIELIGAVVQALRLDIELDANEARVEAGTSAAHANIDRFVSLVEAHLAVDERGTLASLLEWVERAAEADETAEHVAEPEPGTVQLITAHGAKGLEWDLVAVPRLVTAEFPGTSKDGAGWLRTGQLPDELRGDAAARPKLEWRLSATQQELKERIADYKEELKARFADEERRLAYVAVTRAAARLLLSGSFWGGQVKARTPSPFLLELQEAKLIEGLPAESAHEADPSELAELTLTWPLDPLGARGHAVRVAAERLREALTAEPEPTELDTTRPAASNLPLDETVRLLLAERAAQAAPTPGRSEVTPHRSGVREAAAADEALSVDTALAERITASTFHEFIADPVQAERDRLRPLPQRPYRRTRVGNRFHEWVERRATTVVGTALPLPGLEPDLERGDTFALDDLSGFVDLDHFGEDAEALEPLIKTFEASRWAPLRPIAVEQEVTLPFAGRTLVCKLDAVYEAAGADNDAAAAVADDGATQPRFEVVDWKSGRAPRTAREREERFFQLDLYRHAYAQWAGVDPAQIDVSLFYVAEGVELRGEQPRSLAELETIWLEAAAKLNG